MKYKVWLYQINTECYEVTAEDGESAEEKAQKIWMREHKYPTVEYVAELEKDGKEVNQ